MSGGRRLLDQVRDVIRIKQYSIRKRHPGELPWLQGVQRAKRPQHLPVVLNRAEIKHLLAQLEGTVWLMPLSLTAAASGCSNVCACASRTSTSIEQR